MGCAWIPTIDVHCMHMALLPTPDRLPRLSGLSLLGQKSDYIEQWNNILYSTYNVIGHFFLSFKVLKKERLQNIKNPKGFIKLIL